MAENLEDRMYGHFHCSQMKKYKQMLHIPWRKMAQPKNSCTWSFRQKHSCIKNFHHKKTWHQSSFVVESSSGCISRCHYSIFTMSYNRKKRRLGSISE